MLLFQIIDKGLFNLLEKEDREKEKEREAL